MGFGTVDLIALFEDLAAVMAHQRDHLCALDAKVGDADHGIAMQEGMAAAASAVAACPEATFQAMFNAAAKGFLNAVGASTGPLYATAFMRAGKRIGAVSEIPPGDLRLVIEAMCEGVAHRGKAEPGQKTMMDAWHPAAIAAAGGESGVEISEAARRGAEATVDMTASLGRAARLGARSLGHIDPGAASAAMIIARICDCFPQDAVAERPR